MSSTAATATQQPIQPGPRAQLAEARRSVAALCERMGLANADVLRRAYVQNSPDETRRELTSVVHVAGVLVGVATAFHLRAPKSADIGEIASCALVLEQEAAKAVVLCDRVIRERAELAAHGTERPVLSPVRLPGVRGAGDDR